MRRTSFWNNITNKHYWPKTGRSSQKQNMKSNLENQIDTKTNYKISYQKISMKHLEQIMFNQISNLILRRTSCWNNITNKHYWPKTGRSSQKQNMYEKQSQKPNWSKNKLQNFLLKDVNETSWTDNVQPNIKFNIKNQLRNSCCNNMTNKYYWPKTGRSSQKQNMYEKQSQKPN